MMEEPKKTGIFAKVIILILLALVVYVTGYYIWAAIDFYL